MELPCARFGRIRAAVWWRRRNVLRPAGQIPAAKGDLQQAFDELDTKREPPESNPGIVAQRAIAKLEVLQAAVRRA